jgi:nucleoid-associated protein YgaU
MPGLGGGLPGVGLKKARLVVVDGGGQPLARLLTFKYNPETFSVSQSAEWSEPPVQQGDAEPAEPTHQKTNPPTLTMEILLDAFEELRGDVTDDVRTLLDWTKPCPPEVAPGVMNPPLLQFRWGASRAHADFRGYLKDVSATYSLFRMDGTPIRATCNVTLVGVPDPPQGTNPTSGGPSGIRSHVIIEGESLHSVAWATYGAAAYWRALAAFNDIDDPLRVTPGTRLLLPPHRDAARLA